MRFDKLVTVIVATLCGLLLAGPASANPPYPPAPPNLIVKPAVIHVGELVTVIGFNFGPYDIVRITVSYFNLGGSADDVEGAQGLEGDGQGGGGHGGGCKGNDNAFDSSTTVLADASGSFRTTLRLNQTGVAGISAVGRPSGVRASARVLVLCNDNGGDQVGSGQPLASGSSTPARPTAVSWTMTTAGILGGLVPAVLGFAPR